MLRFPIRHTSAPGLARRLLLTLLAVGASGAGAEPLLMLYRDKPPYSYQDKGVAKGYLYELTARTMARAGIDTRFEVVPPKRIFLALQDATQAVCSFGWYRLPERERYARFSAPMHQDRPHVILSGARSSAAVRRHTSLQSLLQDPQLILATADGVSYGPELDAMIAGFPGKIDSALIPPLQVAKKIAARRADFMFIDQDDYDHLLATEPEFKAAGLLRLSYPDLPPGLKRYILCSQKVTPDTMRRIDAALAAELKR